MVLENPLAAHRTLFSREQRLNSDIYAYETIQTSKTLNYIDSPITMYYFTGFVFIWIYLRHYLNLVMISAVILPSGTFQNVGPFILDWAGQQYKCWLSQYITFGLLATLQSINLFWLYFILRIGWNAVFTSVQKDVRSDDEEDEEEEEPVATEKANGKEKNDKSRPLTNGIANGNALEGHDSYRDAVIEGKKEK